MRRDLEQCERDRKAIAGESFFLERCMFSKGYTEGWNRGALGPAMVRLQAMTPRLWAVWLIFVRDELAYA